MSGSQTTALQMLAAQYAQQYGVPVQAFLDRVTNESTWNPNAIGPPVTTTVYGKPVTQQAVGLGQILPTTANDPGLNGVDPITDPSLLTDAATNLKFSAQYLGALITKYGSPSAALAAYTGQPASNFTQYDDYASELPADNLSTGLATGSPTMTLSPDGSVTTTPSITTSNVGNLVDVNAGNSNTQTSLSGWINSTLVEVFIVVTGMIFLAIGLKMLANPGMTAGNATGKLVRSVTP